MAKLPSHCRVCGAERARGALISWRGLCPPCGNREVVQWARDLSDITHERYWDAARGVREGIRKRQLADIQATIAAYPDLA